MVEVSCGGGDASGGDEDEESFEINNLGATANFELKSHCVCVGDIAKKTFTTLNNSYGTGSLNYNWKVTDSTTMITNTFSSFEPSFMLDAKNKYLVELIVTDSLGCTSNYKVNDMSQYDTTHYCSAVFDYKYNWCNGCDKNGGGINDITVSFTNNSSFANCANGIYYKWYFGDGDSSELESPTHTYKNLTCSGKDFKVSMTITLGDNADNPDYCTSTSEQKITINPLKATLKIDNICCDGTVYFSTPDAIDGRWRTPGSMNKPTGPWVSSGIYKNMFGNWKGRQHYQFYNSTGSFKVSIDSAMSKYHNVCNIVDSFVISEIECINKSTKDVTTSYFSGITVKQKLRGTWLPNHYKVSSKIKTVGFKKMDYIATNFLGYIYSDASSGVKCYCTPRNISASSTSTTGKRKAKISVTYSGKYRIGSNKVIANYNITHHGSTPTLSDLNIGRSKCIRPLHFAR